MECGNGLVVVTGGLGFIGSHTVEELLERGYSVLVVDNLYSGSPSNLPRDPRVVFAKTDVSMKTSLDNALSRYRECSITGIIHLAALVNLVEVQSNPSRALRVNVMGTLNVLEAARRLDVDRIVYASSVAVYGEPKNLPISENHPREPSNLYGLSKLMGEQLLERYSADYDMKTVSLRYFNVYGPRMRPGPYAGVVLKFIEAMRSGKNPIIYGSGEQTRDFVYVGDVARANVRALEKDVSGVFNIGTGRSISIVGLYELLCRLVEVRCPRPNRMPARKGDIMHSRASIIKAEKTLGWKPHVSLEEGLRITLEHYGIAIKSR